MTDTHDNAEAELDDIMEDLIVGHNFEYARGVLLHWRGKAVLEAVNDAVARLPKPRPLEPDVSGESSLQTRIGYNAGVRDCREVLQAMLTEGPVK